MSKEVVTYVDLGLSDLAKILSEDIPTAKVGVIGQSGFRPSDDDDGPSNADVGLWQEFGTAINPMRSFLRIPLIDNMQKYLNDAGAFGEDVIKKIIEEKSFYNFMVKVGIVGESIVADAFDSAGFGKWKPSNMTNKTNQQTLVETQQLRNSVSSEVVSND